MTRMTIRLRLTLSTALPVTFLLTLLLLAACANTGPQTAQSTPKAVPHASSAAVAPSFPDLSRGNAQTAAKLLSFDASARSAVLEPTIFMDGPGFCAKFYVETPDPRCEREWVAEDSNVKVTLPVDAHAKLATIRGGDPGCMGGTQGSGSCPLTAAEFASLAKQSPGMLVQVTVKDGTLTQMAEQYTP
jgi:hypothetical protein